MKPETLFTNRINRHVPPKVRVEKMHNIYRGGTPDFWYSGNKDDLWVEYKWIPKLPVKAAVKVNLSMLQTLWLADAFEKGRNVCVIVGSPKGCAILTDGAWKLNVSHNEFRHSELAVARWLIEKLHVPIAAAWPYGSSYKSGVPDSVYIAPDCRNGTGDAPDASATERNENESD